MKLRRRSIEFIGLALAVLVVAAAVPALRGQAGPRKSTTKTATQATSKQTANSAKQNGISRNTPQSIGSWSAPVNLCPSDGNVCTIGVFAALLHNGSVLYYYRPPQGQMGSRAVVFNPFTGAITDVQVPFPRDIFCSGITVLEDGRVLVTGGDYPGRTNGTSGTVNTTIFDPVTNTWSEGSDMAFARWYPGNIELGDGTILEFGGTEEDGKTEAYATESYNYDTDGWTTLPDSANLPQKVFKWYPGTTLLTSGLVFASNSGPDTYTFDPSSNTWTYLATMNYGARFHGSHVLLPGLNRVMVAGGTSDDSVDGGGTATNTAEIIDFTSKTPTWSYANPMTYARNNLNLTLLADGTVMAEGGGGGNGKYANPVFVPELYNPATGKWNVLAAQAVQRTYHSTSLLLQDGRVISAGSDNGGSQQISYEIYSPPYLFKGQRPVITSAPKSVVYGQSFTVATASAANIKHVALIRPSTNSHADGFDQRYLYLSYTVGSGQLTVTAPADGNHAPPGWYMLVILDSNNIPSFMPFMKVSDGN